MVNTVFLLPSWEMHRITPPLQVITRARIKHCKGRCVTQLSIALFEAMVAADGGDAE